MFVVVRNSPSFHFSSFALPVCVSLAVRESCCKVWRYSANPDHPGDCPSACSPVYGGALPEVLRTDQREFQSEN